MATPACSLKTPQKSDSGNGRPAPPLAGTVSKVRVVVRVRPFLPQEVSSGNVRPVSCVSLLPSQSEFGQEATVLLKDQETSRRECYKLDSFYGEEDNNVSQIFHKEINHLIPGIFRGFNATVFASGATGSGKTYTMQGSDEQQGLISMAMSAILSLCQITRSTVAISYYEVYMDRCYDLLEPKTKEIIVMDGKDGQIHLKGLVHVPVTSMTEFHSTFSSAVQRRKVAHTGLNDVSSRSHGVLVIAVSTPSDDCLSFVTGKLNLIDLAGNEDNKRTLNEGIRLQESGKINQSLFALSSVICALNDNKTYIPYRQSKLTRILQDSLGGTSSTLMVACLKPGEYQESVNTVSLAARSRHISNFVLPAQKQETPKVKVDMEAKMLAWLESKGKTKSAQRAGAFRSPFLTKTPGSLSSTRKLTFTCQRYSGIKGTKTMTCCDALNNRGVTDFVKETTLNLHDTSERNTEHKLKEDFINGGIPPDEENMRISKDDDELAHSSLEGEKLMEYQSPARKVLFPINSNIINIEDLSSKNDDPRTPKTPVLGNADDMFQSYSTPLDKFNERSSNLKSSFIQEYVDFLNTASRKELMELKGIGEKMADYILELRETSPLKSLSDLQKVGLSSKQVHNMLGKAARGIFQKIKNVMFVSDNPS